MSRPCWLDMDSPFRSDLGHFKDRSWGTEIENIENIENLEKPCIPVGECNDDICIAFTSLEYES